MYVPNRNVHHRKLSARCDYAGQILIVLHFVFSRDNSVWLLFFSNTAYTYVNPHRVYCNPLASSSLSIVSFSAAASSTSELCEEETASVAVCEEREQESSGDESDKEENTSSENGDVDDEQMKQVCVNPPLIHSLFLT